MVNVNEPNQNVNGRDSNMQQQVYTIRETNLNFDVKFYDDEGLRAMNQACIIDDDDKISSWFNYNDNGDEDNSMRNDCDERMSNAKEIGIDVGDCEGRDINGGVEGGESEKTSDHLVGSSQ